MKKLDNQTLNRLLYSVNKPYQYAGHELYSYNKDFETSEVRFAIAFPDKYEVGASNLGHRIIYETLNSIDGCMCDRAYAPDTDCKVEIEKQDLYLYAVESKVRLKDFDLLGFSLQYELAYPTVLAMMNMADIPVKNADRTEDDPIILSGGPCAFNPEPMREFIDGFLIGDGEDILKEVVETYKLAKNQGKTRKQIIDKLKSGLYPENIIYKVIEYLEEYNLINDKRYAMLYLDYKKSVYSKRKIIQDLYTKGISKELIDEAFMESDFSEDDSISSVLKKRAKRYDLSDSKDLQKLYRYLVGKGYSFSMVKKAVDNYILEQKNSFYE